MIWRLEYENAHGDVARLDIQRGASTPVEIIEGTEDPFLLSYELEDKSKKGFIMSSFADISIYETDTFNIDDLKTLDETALSVKWYINNDLEWTGFVVPDFFSRDIGEPAIVNLAASDRLSSLKDATLDGLSEYVKLKDLAIACLAKTGLSLPLVNTVDFKADTTNIMDAFAMSERLEDDKGKKISCFDVLRSILVLTNSTIRQRKGHWRIYNKIQHEALAPTLTFNEVYQGAKKTIQPVLASVGAFQEFGGNREFPSNNSFKKNDSNWTKGGSPLFVANFDNRDFSFATATAPAVFGQATNQNQLINRNVFNSGATSLSGTPYLKSVDIKVPLEDTGTGRGDYVPMTIEINSKSVHQSIAHFAVVRFYDGVVEAYLATNLSWKPFFSTIDINYIQENIRSRGYGVEDITTIETRVAVGRGKDPSKYKIAVYILGVTREGSPTNRMAAIRSVKIIFPESSDFGEGILYRTDQIGNFSKKSNPDTTIFGDFITMGLNGYFYPYRDNDKSALKTVVGGTYSSTTEWTTATDPGAGELPILQHVTRQMSRMFGVAHNVLSAVIDAKTFDPLAIVTNCAGEKYVIVASTFDFLRSTVEVELQQIAYGSLQRRDFIFSYFGGGDGDGISSIGSVSGGGSYSGGGGGSFLDKYFSFDEENDALVANVSLVSEKEIAAYFADETLPSIFDSIPFATSSKVGGIKAASTFKDGIRINSLGFLEIDPSYADSGVSSWSDLTDKPTSFPPTSHNHPISDVTGLQTALNGKLGTGAQAYDSARLGGQLSSKFTQRDVAETISKTWNFSRINASNYLYMTASNPRIEFHDTATSQACRWILSGGYMRLHTLEYGTSNYIHSTVNFSTIAPRYSMSLDGSGNLSILGNITAQGEVTAYSSSDVRLKQNIKPIEDALGIISKLNPIAFNWNDKAVELNEVKNTESINYGVIAQEIEKVLPELVHETNGFKSVDYSQLFGILIKAIQELNLKIKE